jgi:sterol desaturase/sphingolipid hydroxylase (fatty acid hydroxylase superfamily)
MSKILRTIVAWMAWPGLLAGCIAATQLGFSVDQPMLAFYVTYTALALVLLLLQRWMPHERTWSQSDGQLGPDIAHTLVSTGAVQGMLAFSGMIGLSIGITMLGGSGLGLWPRQWPLALQVVLGLVVLEFALYWAHRLAHECLPLWYFHAVHHSVERLSIVNSGRFHFIDAVKSVLPGILLLLALGAPMDVLTWLSALGAYIGILTHCNVEMRFGVLSLIFTTPELHRWHHSMDLREGNKNYGESLAVWDWVFGTWFNENRRPPADIGVPEAMPAQFHQQIVWPFHKLFARGCDKSSAEQGAGELRERFAPKAAGLPDESWRSSRRIQEEKQAIQ